MRVITVRQPWAWAIAEGAKTVENRSTNTNYRGPLAIHAGTKWSARGWYDDRVRSLASAVGGATEEVFQPREVQHPAFGTIFPLGFVLAVAELEDCHPDVGCCRPWGESEYTEAGGARRTRIHHLVLSDIRRLPVPIQAPGRLGLWKPDPDLAAEIEQGLSLVAIR